jgi:hypothetical protein
LSQKNFRRFGRPVHLHPGRRDLEPVSFANLAHDLKSVWTAPTTDARLKKSIARTVIREAIADLDAETAEIVVIIHWMGGEHTEHRLPRRWRGQRNSASAEIDNAARQLDVMDHVAGLTPANCRFQRVNDEVGPQTVRHRPTDAGRVEPQDRTRQDTETRLPSARR